MHRIILILPFLLFLVPAATLGQPEKKRDVRTYPTDLFPLKIGNRWIYQGTEPKEKVIVTVDRMEPVRIASTDAKAGSSSMEVESYVLRTTNGDKSLQEQIMVLGDGIYRYAAAG